MLNVKDPLWCGVFSAAAALGTLAFTDLSSVLHRVDVRVAYEARELLGRTPDLDPRLKIFALDDRGVSSLQRYDPTPTDWAQTLRAISANKPAVIIVDKLFDTFFTAEDAEVLHNAFAQVEVPVYVIAFATTEPIAGRPVLPPLPSRVVQVMGDTSAWALRQPYVYGVRDPVLGTSLRYAHGMSSTYDSVQALVQSNSEVLPYAGLLAARTMSVSADGLQVDGVQVPLFDKGRLLVDLPNRAKLISAVRPLAAVIERGRRGMPLTSVVPGDVVVLMPGFYTGTADVHESPIGMLAGGFRIVATANSVLRGQYLSPFPFPWILVTLTTIGAVMLGAWARRRHVWWQLLTLAVLLGAGGVVAFAWLGVLVPVALSATTAATAALGAFARRGFLDAMTEERVSHELRTSQTLQKALLPDLDYHRGALRIVGRTRMSSELGGDWWHVMDHGERGATVFIGDATGHGVPAALITTFAHALATRHVLAENAAGIEGVQRFAAEMSAVIAKTFDGTMLMTMLCCHIDLERQEIIYINWGHILPMATSLLGEERKAEKVRVRGDPIGLATSITPVPKVEELSPTRIALYTDGVYETYSTVTDPTASMQPALQLNSALEAGADLPGAIDRVLDDAQRKDGNLSAPDDRTFVVIEWTGATAQVRRAG